MNSESLWDIPTIDEDMNSTENVKRIIIQQADYLEKSTNNTIQAKFGKLRATGVKGAIEFSAKIAAAISDLESIGNTEVEGVATEKLKNADGFYSSETYGFEIYSTIYRFRIFEIKLYSMYPIFIRVDEDIFEEIKNEISGTCLEDMKKRLIQVSSQSDLEYYLKEIFQSRKVRFVIQKMLQKAAEKKEE